VSTLVGRSSLITLAVLAAVAVGAEMAGLV